MANLAPCPYMVKTFKNLQLQNQSVDDREIKYIALSTWVLPKSFKWWPWVDLDLFKSEVNYGKMLILKISWKVLKILAKIIGN